MARTLYLPNPWSKIGFVIHVFTRGNLGPVYMEAGLARLARQPGILGTGHYLWKGGRGIFSFLNF